MTSSSEHIVYPPGVRDLSEDISTNDLVKQLEKCVEEFQSMAQEEENARRYEPLAEFLISERFLEHKSREVRLLVACCIADIFRISAPDAPYKREEEIKTILEFFLDQLKSLSSPNNPKFKLYFYLLENLSVVKTFNVCFELQDSQSIMCRLFKLVFKIICDHQNQKFQRICVDLLCPLINEADIVPAELINIIFNHIIEPMKSQNKNACILAQEILRKTASSIGTYVQAYFTNEFYLGEPNVSERLCDLIYELYIIDSGMMNFVIPQLEGKLKSSDEKERLMVTKLVARMFSDNKYNMIEENKMLWTSFLARFNDISANVRLLCIKYASNFLLHHPESKEEVLEMLKQRIRDVEEEVRYHVITAIFSVAKQDISCINNDILLYIKERTLDKKFRIRKESLLGLAKLYKQYVLDSEHVTPDAEKLLGFVKYKVLSSYYLTTPDDKFLVERILHTCLVPYQSPMEKRMKLLYQLYCTADQYAERIERDYAARAFKEILKNQKHMRTLTNELLEIIQLRKTEKTQLLAPKIHAISKNFSDPKKSVDYLSKFCQDLQNNIRIRGMMSLLLNGNIKCAEAESKVKEILRSLGKPVSTNLYYNFIKQLLERIVPVLLDKESVKYLVSIANDSVVGNGTIEAELKLENSAPKGFDLINALAITYPQYFVDEELFSTFIKILQSDVAEIAEITLEILNNISKDLENNHHGIFCELLDILKNFTENGTPRQAKRAVHLIYKMVTKQDTLKEVFEEMITNLPVHFTMKSRNFRTALVSVGRIANLCSGLFAKELGNIVAQTVVRKLLMAEQDFPRGGEELWGPFDSLPEETKVKIEGMKLMVRWLTGLKEMVQAAGSTFKLLNAVLEHDGDLMENKCLGPKECSWMRYYAANCFLKLCQEPKYAECLPISFFLRLAYVMNDTCPEVRDHFATKLNNYLYFMKLPMEFIAIFAIGLLDPRKEFREQIKHNLRLNIIKRKEYVKEKAFSADQLPHHWPDYSLSIVVYLLAHAPFFKVYDDVESLHKIKECLKLFIDVFTSRNTNFCFAFYKRLLENIKQTKDKLEPENESRNLKLYAVCDLALIILMSRQNFVLKDFPGQPKLNSKFFTQPDKTYSNVVTYLPPALLTNMNDLVKSGFEFKLFDKSKEKGSSSNLSSSQEEPTVTTSQAKPIPSTSKASVPSNSNTNEITSTSTDLDSSVTELKSVSSSSKHSDNASQNSTGSFETEQSENMNLPATYEEHLGGNDFASEIEKQLESNVSFNNVTNLKNGDIDHSNSISNQSDMELDKDASSLENNKMNGKYKKVSVSKKRLLLKRAVNNCKQTRSMLSIKDAAASTLCSENSKQNGMLPSSPSATSVSSSCASEYENMIKPCSVILEKIKHSQMEVCNGNLNGSVSFKRKHNFVDSEDNSSNQESSAGSHPSEETPRKRGRPPKKGGKVNEESKLLADKKKCASVSTSSVLSSRSSSRTTKSSSIKSSPVKPVVKNGKFSKEKKSPIKSKLNISQSLSSKNKLRDELNAEINVINNKTVKSKQINGLQKKKIVGKSTRRRR